MARNKTWTNLIAVSELEPNDATPVKLGKRDLAVYDTVSGITVSLARCTHGAANLCDGYFDGKHIECPLHQGLFDAHTGLAIALPARIRLRMFEARVLNGIVQIKL